MFQLFINEIPADVVNKLKCLQSPNCMQSSDLWVVHKKLHAGLNNLSIIPKIQTDVNRVLKWFSDNNLTVNSEKSFAIVVGSRQKLASLPFRTLQLLSVKLC